MRKVITGEQVAQLYNRDPFALPAWRAPIYQTPAGIILLVQLFRLIRWLVRLIARHPVASLVPVSDSGPVAASDTPARGEAV